MTVEITGLRELISSLSSKETEIIKAARKANLAGADVIAQELKMNVPSSGYSGPNAQPTLANSVVASGNRTDNATYESYVAVGFNRSANFRAHLPEFGSISQAPQGYMSKTVQSVESKVVKNMERAIRGVLS